MSLKCGIVGLPNVGKSTLFNALTSTMAAEAANYPFCTIEPNIGRVAVPDDRLMALAEIAGSKEIIHTQIDFVDIAGLVKGASKGEGLGNQFLGHIREVDAIIYVLRCFDNDDIIHVAGNVDPLRDAEIIETELMLADLESLQKRRPNLEKKAKQDKGAAAQLQLIEEIIKLLNDGKPAREILKKEGISKNDVNILQLLTSKPILYACNVPEKDVNSGNIYTQSVSDKIGPLGAEIILISAQIEAEIALLQNQAEKEEFLSSIGLTESALSKLIKSSYKALDLITFFTIGPKEARAWNIKENTTAPDAAGVIHTDFTRGFICAETISYDDYIKHSGEIGAKEAGKMRLEGREYIIRDGDVMHFRFNI
ncbi:MAG: redox-regulated ATPase YchF [Candidatus Lariskella arthropodorum]